MPEDSEFIYDWYTKLSKYNTLRFEDINRERWKEMDIGRFIRNDRFYCKVKPPNITVKIRKIYTVTL